MTAIRSPRLEKRRTSDFERELVERMRAWVPSWGSDDEHEFGRALLKIAARFSAEVAERVDRSGDKMRRGFFDWLGVKGAAARPARMPVVFKTAAKAAQAVLARAPVRMQGEAQNAPVVFETESDVRIVPGRLAMVVATDTDGDHDALFLPPPRLSDIEPAPPAPSEWRLKRFAAAEAIKLQLDPPAGLVKESIIEAAGQRYRIVNVDQDIVTVEPKLSDGLPALTIVRKVTSFSPFEGTTRNRQEHVLYLGHTELLNIEAPATFEIVGARELGQGVTWQYWGKRDQNEAVDWQPLDIAPERDQQPDALVLNKPKGAVEPFAIAKDKNSRWIRAVKTTVAGSAPLLQADELAIRVNCRRQPVPCPPAPEAVSPAAEAMANTTPLVLDSVFFPLGKEPRQFDAFYLGSNEAFSKKGAEVQLCFEMADPTFTALAALRDGPLSDKVLVGVGQDRALHLFELVPSSGIVRRFGNRDPLRPPLPGFNGQAPSSTEISLDPRPPWRLPVWAEGDDFLVAASAGADIWIWHEKKIDPQNSGWIPFGQVAGTAGTLVDGLVFLSQPSAKLAALRDGKLFLRDWPSGTEWKVVATMDGTTPVVLRSIVPIVDNAGINEMVGVSAAKKLFQVSTSGACAPLLPAFTFSAVVRPSAVKVGLNLFVTAFDDSTSRLRAFQTPNPPAQQTLAADVVGPLETVLSGTTVHVIATCEDGRLVTWAPFASGVAATLLESEIPSGVGQTDGGPTVIGGHVVIPGANADTLVADFDLVRRRVEIAALAIGIVVPDSIPPLAVGDVVARQVGLALEGHTVTSGSASKAGETFYPIDSGFSALASGPLLAYRMSFNGTFASPNKLTLNALDHETGAGTSVAMDGHFFTVSSVTSGVATLVPNPPASASGKYGTRSETGGRVAPFLRLDASTNGNWNAALLDRIPLVFPPPPITSPTKQRGKAFVTLGNNPIVIALGEEFTPPLGSSATFVLDAALGDWQRSLGHTSTNPELSWEYWNGTGWWKIDVTLDATQHLKTSGMLRLSIPPDIAPTDWAGKMNHWIRARLIGGDYGREKISVKISPPDPAGVTEQTIERSTAGIRPPSVVGLHISYSICNSVPPTFVLTADSGSIRDQSDANRTDGAIVEAFVPLSVTIGRLLANGDVGASEDGECLPECDCPGETVSSAPSNAAAPELNAPMPVAPAAGRSLFLGFDAPLAGDTVNVLLLVAAEYDNDAFAPLGAEALVGNRLVPLVVKDGTRALGESGVLTFSFPQPPTQAELFGHSLRWIRLVPSGGSTGWNPSLRGAYLNAVWASATETLTRELLGSSEGAPGLTVTLARPPVLRDSLVLRVREPLSDEERQALRDANPDSVWSDVPGLPGDWVLWEQAIDPSDEEPMRRVYSLDEKSGEIRFGDGRHGAIPPVGRDSIVAFRYQRTEPPAPGAVDVPANSVEARKKLNLVTPVAGVEAVFAADHAAGGAPPEPDARVLRFGMARLRHRGRAITLPDLEDLALESSPDIVQSHAIVRGARTELVVVMRGDDPVPRAAQKRELKRLLLSAMPAVLRRDAFAISAPKLRHLRIVLHLRVANLDHAGSVSEAVKSKLANLLDTATGAASEEGWPLGASPREEDIAHAVIGVPHLQSIAQIELVEIRDDQTQHPWPDALAPHELARLAEDAFRFRFESMEAAA